MFLTDKHTSLLPAHHHHSAPVAPAKPSRRQRQRQQELVPGKAAHYEAALAARLRGLLPLPASPLAALARVADVLAAALAEAAPALGPGEGDDAAAVAAHLDGGVALLDACNAIAARLDRLRRRRLLARFALHSLPTSPPRARAALADRDADGHAHAHTPPPALPSLPFDLPPRGGGRGRLSPAARVLVAVDAVSSLAAAAAAAALDGSSASASAFFPRVSGAGAADFPWAEAFNAVSAQLEDLSTGASEVDAVDEAVGGLASVLDGEGDASDEAEAAREVEERTEELSARLDRLSDAVNAVFSAALGLRNAALGSFMVAPAEKTSKRKY